MSHSTARMLPVLLVFIAAACAEAQPARGLNELGIIAFSAKRYPEALEHFEQALALDPRNPSLRRNVCRVHQAMANDLADSGQFEEALSRVLLGAEADPENAEPRAQAGSYALRLGRVDEAMGMLEEALSRAPDNVEALALMGEARYQKNDLNGAREAWEKALAGRPDWPDLQGKLDKLMREAPVEAGFAQYAAGNFQISYAKALSDETRDLVFSVLEEAWESVAARLGGLTPPGTVQVVLYDGAQFAEATDTAAHVGALYDGKIRAPITDRRGRFLPRRTLSTRLTHEFVHVVVVSHLGPKAPWWLNEGLADTFSREMDQSRARLLSRAAHAGALHALRDLESNQLQALEKDALAVAYAQSHAAVQRLWDAGGAAKMAAFIGRLKEGAAVEAALRSVYGLDYAALGEVGL